jgi:hypothetical protein
MSFILIRCPKTGKPVNTMLEAASQADFDKTDYPNDTIRCPHCGETHFWSKQDCFLDKASVM